MIVVSDTSPITYLMQIDKVYLLQQLFQTVIIPLHVYKELCAVDDQKKWLMSESAYWIEVKQATDLEFVKRLNAVLDKGESEAIALAKELKAEVILVDELKGRNIAIEEGLMVTGVMGVLLAAKRQNSIIEIKSSIDNLIKKGFRISDNIYHYTDPRK